jgi:hypothetical protein
MHGEVNGRAHVQAILPACTRCVKPRRKEEGGRRKHGGGGSTEELGTEGI